MRRLAIVVAGLVVLGASAGLALALSTKNGSGYTFVGPFINDSAKDVTTCGTGTIWAEGTLSNAYKVFPQRPDGSYVVYEELDSKLVTFAGQSVGACNNGSPDNGNTVGAGIKVRVDAAGMWVIRNGSFDPDATCQAVNPACFIPAFTRSFFGPSATFEEAVRVLAVYETRCNGSWIGPAFVFGESAGDITGSKNDCENS